MPRRNSDRSPQARSRHAQPAASAAPACSGKQKNTACTRQAVQFVGRGDVRRKERHSRDGTAIVRRRRDRVTRNTRRQPRLRVRANKKHGSYKTSRAICWQGRRDSNTQPTVLETATLPLSHSPKRLSLYNKNFVKSNRFYRFGGEKGVLL